MLSYIWNSAFLRRSSIDYPRVAQKSPYKLTTDLYLVSFLEKSATLFC